MAGIKISNLPAAASSLLTDIFPAVQAGATDKETLQQVMTLFQASMTDLSGLTGEIKYPTAVTFVNGNGNVRTNVNAGNTLSVSAYDVDGATYLNFFTVTAGNTPTGDLKTDVTIGAKYIYRVDGTDVALADGGLNASLVASNGGIFYSTATAGAILAGTATANQVLLSGATAAPSWSTAAYPASTTINELLYSSAANTIAGLATAASGVLVTSAGGVPSISTDIPTAVTIGTAYIYRVGGGDVNLADGGTNNSLVASTGGIVYSTVDRLDILAGVATAGRIIRSGATAAPTWSAASYPDGATINEILYASAANTIGWIVAANNGVLVSSNTGVPSMLAGPGTTGNILQSNAAAAPSFSTATYPVSTTINELLYSSAANVVSGLATAASGVLVTSGAGVPSIATDIPTAVTIGGQYVYRAAGTDVPITDGGTGSSDADSALTALGGAAYTGTGGLVRATSPSLVTPALGVATATSINFGQDALNYYDEGTFTPTVSAGGGTIPQYSTNTGIYTRIGRMVFVTIYLTGDGGDEGAGANQMSIALPFAPAASMPQSTLPVTGIAFNNASSYPLTGNVVIASSTIAVRYWSSITDDTAFPLDLQNNANRSMFLHFNYFV